MEQQRHSIVITRGNIGQLGSFIAGIGILIGAIGFIWQGGITVFVIVPLVAGILGIVLWAWMTPQDFRNFVTGRQVRHGTVAFFSTLLVIGIVSLIYILIAREVQTFDITLDTRFTLDETTLDVLEAVKRSPRDLQITAFYTSRDIVQRELDDQYFRLYETQTDSKIKRVYIDPLEQPGIAERYRGALAQGQNVFLSYLNEDGTVDFESTIIVNNQNSQERSLTQAISQLLAAGEFIVYFERSLGTLDPLSGEQQGMSTINNLTRGNGLVTEPLSLEELAATDSDIPQNASALILSRPTRQVTEAEIGVVDRYLQTGGSLLILTDIFFTDNMFMAEDTPFHNYIKVNYGIFPLDLVIADPASSGNTALDIASAQVFLENSIGTNINIENNPDSRTLFRLARPIEVVQHASAFNGRIIMTTPFSWGEANLDAVAERNDFEFAEGEDIQGPLTTVAWAFDEETGAKIVMIGDGDFITNGQVQSPGGNALIFLDSLGWLTGFTEEVTFGFQPILTTPLIFISGQMLDIIAFITIVFMPGVMLVAAGAIAWRRMRV